MSLIKKNKWRVIKSEYLAKKPWYTVRHETIELPSGERIEDYYVFEYPEWVNIIAITKEGEMVIISQYRHGLGEYGYEIPAGCVDQTDTSPLEAAKRELLEESGYGGGNWELLTTICANPATQNNLTYCFVARDVELVGVQNLDRTEEIEVQLMEPEEVKNLLLENKILQALMVAPLWKYIYTQEIKTNQKS
ncbi:MAG: NUDIX hydrolase [Rikenellaceae bacterium]